MADESGEYVGSFLEFIAQMAAQEKLGNIDGDFAAVVDATRANGGKSTLTLTLDVSVFQKGHAMGTDEPVAVVIHPGVTTKLARPSLAPALKFASVGGALWENDPRQATLFPAGANVISIDSPKAVGE